jgi:hypothetical protein
MFWRVTGSSCSWSSSPKRLCVKEHGIIFQKTWIFSIAAVRTSSLILLSLILKVEVNTASCDTLCLLCTLMLSWHKWPWVASSKWMCDSSVHYLRLTCKIIAIVSLRWIPSSGVHHHLAIVFKALILKGKKLLNSNGCCSIGSDKWQNTMKLWFQLRWQ